MHQSGQRLVPCVPGGLRVPVPHDRRISKRQYRHIVQSVCPWNQKLSQELADGSPSVAPQFIAGKDAVTLATDLLTLAQETFRAVLRNSPRKRANFRIGNSIGLGRVSGVRTARSRTPRGPAGARRPDLRPPPRRGGRLNGVFRRRPVAAGGRSDATVGQTRSPNVPARGKGVGVRLGLSFSPGIA